MADLRITELGNLAAATTDDLLAIVDDPAGSPVTKKITTGALFTSPTFTTNITTPKIIGGTGTTQTLTYQTTSGVGATGARHIFLVGNNGATEAMTILNSGFVGIGTTGPSNKLHVYAGEAGGTVTPDADVLLALEDSDNVSLQFLTPNNRGGYIYFGDQDNLYSGYIAYTHSNNAMTFRTNNSDAVTINSSGNVGIGSTAPGSKLSVAGGASFGSTYAASSAPADGMIIQGNVGIGSTAPGSKLSVAGGISVGSTYASSSAPTSGMIIEGNVGIGTTAPGYLLTMGIGGGYYNQATGAWTAGSDIAYKTNISDLTKYGLETVKNLRPVSYTVKQSGVDQVGFIAQEVKGLVPELVSGNDGSMGLNYGGFAPILVKAIQEQQLQIASLSGQLAPLLQVDGSCVTGDTLLPIRRRRKSLNGLKSEDDNLLFDYLLCRIDEILPGDEVSSLNEFTGSLEWHKISALKDMDIKEVFELTTKSGKVIRTTAKHPYLTLLEDNPVVSKGGIK